MLLTSNDIPELQKLIWPSGNGGIAQIKDAEISLSVALFLAVTHRALRLSGQTSTAGSIARLGLPGVSRAINCLAEPTPTPSPDPLGAPSFDLLRIASKADVSETPWYAFLDRFRRSGSNGRQTKMFDSVSSVIGEIGDNVVGHAFEAEDKPCPAIAGFHVANGTASFCVADVGQGFLNSLHRSPKWKHLRNDLDALDAVVFQQATSRPNEETGGGFKLLFSRMLEFNGMVVLRSGTSTFHLSNTGRLGDPINRRADHSAHIPGASVTAVFAPSQKPVEIPLKTA